MNLDPLHLTLESAHCTSLVLQTAIPCNPSQIDTLRGSIKRVRQSEAWPWLFIDVYRVGRATLSIHGSFSPRENSELYDVSLHFVVGKTPRRRSASVHELVDVLSNNPADLESSCYAEFGYSEGDGKQSMELPIVVPGPTGLKAEVRGMRLALLKEDGSEEFSIILDRPIAPTYFHHISFSFLAPFSSHLPGQVLERALDISRSFLDVSNETKQPTLRKAGKT